MQNIREERDKLKETIIEYFRKNNLKYLGIDKYKFYKAGQQATYVDGRHVEHLSLLFDD